MKDFNLQRRIESLKFDFEQIIGLLVEKINELEVENRRLERNVHNLEKEIQGLEDEVTELKK